MKRERKLMKFIECGTYRVFSGESPDGTQGKRLVNKNGREYSAIILIYHISIYHSKEI